jgi:hypothetical protein
MQKAPQQPPLPPARWVFEERLLAFNLFGYAHALPEGSRRAFCGVECAGPLLDEENSPATRCRMCIVMIEAEEAWGELQRQANRTMTGRIILGAARYWVAATTAAASLWYRLVG